MPQIKSLILSLSILFINSIYAQQHSIDSLKYWSFNAKTNINLTQGAISNWTEGGETYMSLLSILKADANYKKNKSSWDNGIEMRYGSMLVRDRTKPNNTKTIRTDDRFEISTTYGQRLYKNINMSALGNIKSQFVEGYDYPNDSVPVSDFMSPAKMYLALGFEYKKGDSILFNLSPITSKTTMVASSRVDETKYGLDKGERSKREIGLYFKILYKRTIWKNIEMENKLILFSNYAENPQNIDFDYQVDFNMKVNKYIQASLHFHFIYDHDIDIPVYDYSNKTKTKIGITKGLQFKELLSIGFIYSLEKK